MARTISKYSENGREEDGTEVRKKEDITAATKQN